MTRQTSPSVMTSSTSYLQVLPQLTTLTPRTRFIMTSLMLFTIVSMFIGIPKAHPVSPVSQQGVSIAGVTLRCPLDLDVQMMTSLQDGPNAQEGTVEGGIPVLRIEIPCYCIRVSFQRHCHGKHAAEWDENRCLTDKLLEFRKFISPSSEDDWLKWVVGTRNGDNSVHRFPPQARANQNVTITSRENETANQKHAVSNQPNTGRSTSSLYNYSNNLTNPGTPNTVVLHLSTNQKPEPPGQSTNHIALFSIPAVTIFIPIQPSYHYQKREGVPNGRQHYYKHSMLHHVLALFHTVGGKEQWALLLCFIALVLIIFGEINSQLHERKKRLQAESLNKHKVKPIYCV